MTNLQEYIAQNKNTYSKEQLKTVCIQAGNSPQAFEEAWLAAQNTNSQSSTTQQLTTPKHTNNTFLLSIVLTFVLVGAGIIIFVFVSPMFADITDTTYTIPNSTTENSLDNDGSIDEVPTQECFIETPFDCSGYSFSESDTTYELNLFISHLETEPVTLLNVESSSPQCEPQVTFTTQPVPSNSQTTLTLTCETQFTSATFIVEYSLDGFTSTIAGTFE